MPSMILEWLKRTIFPRKLIEDVRTPHDDSLLTFDVTALLGVVGGTHDVTPTTCSILPPDFGFYTQLIAIVILQSLFNAILGAVVYKILIEPHRNSASSTSQNNGRDNKNYNDLQAMVFAFGIALPAVILEPIYIIQALEVQNAGLIMVFLATPIVNSLRILEALYGFAPVPATISLYNYVMYFSCVFGMEFEDNRPKRVTFEFFQQRFKTVGRDFVIASLLISVLHPYQYEFFPTATPVDSMDHTLMEMISWRHLLNNFCVALLISTSLSQSSLGVSFIYNLLYGVQTYEIVLNPMLRSKSPSDFWGRRWNLLVHKGLKNAVYKPTRKHTASRMWAVAATFAVSGIIHEYVNYVMFPGKTYQFKWKQMLFFGWNGLLILLEYTIGHWLFFRWMSERFTPVLVTALVISLALPLAHLFTGDWIEHGYFDAVYLAEPIVVCQ